MHASTAVVVARRRAPVESVPAPVATENPGPPMATTTTLASDGPAVAISPAVEHPINGVPGASEAIPARSWSRS
jgi:hypothetical protein